MAAIARIRPWSGPALFSYGFRPFFLLAGAQALWTVGVWTGFQLALWPLPVSWAPSAWHAHELVFGHGSAAMAGFLLTAIPNWTGRLPLSGWPLAGLAGLWLCARLSILAADRAPLPVVAVGTTFFLFALALLAGREVWVGKNRRNYPVIALVVLFAVTELVFFVELAQTAAIPLAAHGGVAVLLLLIMLIGGRIIPSFTTNWLRHHRPGASLPAPFDRFDAIALVFGCLALAALLVARATLGFEHLAGVVALAAGALHLARLARWRPLATLGEPLLWALHLAYFFIPLGFFAAGSGLLLDRWAYVAASTHLWTMGAIGLMTLAVMTRATRGHTGRALTAPRETAVAYSLLFAGALARALADLFSTSAELLVPLSGALWLVAFVIFVIAYGPMLLKPRLPALSGG